MIKKFWMVYSSNGPRPPSFIHTTATEANLEAARLARLNVGTTFYVLGAEAGVTLPKSEIVWDHTITG